MLGGAFNVANGGAVASPVILAGTSTANNAGVVADVTVPAGTTFVNSGTQTGTTTVMGGTVTSSGALGTVNVTAGSVVTTGGTVVAANLSAGTTLTSSGSLGGTVNVGTGASYAGTGTIGTVNVASGGTLAANGSLAAANFGFSAGANLDITAADPSSASQRDSLSFRYGATFAGAVNIRVFSVDNTGARGAPSIFNPRLGYSWTIIKDATVAANPLPLDLANFVVDATGWVGTQGNWTVALDNSANAATGNADLKLVYVPTNALATINVPTDVSASQVAEIQAIAADSGFNKTGAGILTIDAPLAFTGGINVAEGTLLLANGGTLGTGVLTFAPGTTFTLTKTDGIVANQIGGNGDLVVAGVGVALSGNASFNSVTVNVNKSLAVSGSLAATTSTTVAIGGAIDGTGASDFQLGTTTLAGPVTNAPDTTTKNLTLNSAGQLLLLPGKTLSVTGAVANTGGAIAAASLAATGAITSTGSLLLTGPLSGSVIDLAGTATAASITSVGSFTNAATTTVTGVSSPLAW